MIGFYVIRPTFKHFVIFLIIKISILEILDHKFKKQMWNISIHISSRLS